MKVSVIITTYNQAKTIERSIESVLNQKFNDYEIIIINDGSIDNTSVILNKYKSITKVFNIDHVGMMNAYNEGLKNCSGEYITFCDGDDYWIDPFKLDKQTGYMDNNHDCGFSFTKVKTRIGDFIYGMTVDANYINNNITYDNLLTGNAYIYAQGYMIRKSVFDKYIDFDKFLKFYVWDYPIVLELIRHTKFHCLDFYSAVFVKSEESITQTKSRKKRFKLITGQYRIKLYYILRYGCKITTIFKLVYYLSRRIYSLIFKTWT